MDKLQYTVVTLINVKIESVKYKKRLSKNDTVDGELKYCYESN